MNHKSIYVNTERNDERAIVIFKDFYKDVTINNKKTGTVLGWFGTKTKFRLLNDLNGVSHQTLIDTKLDSKKVDGHSLKTISELNLFLIQNPDFELSSEESSPLICIEPIGPAYSLNNSKLTGDKRNLLSLPNIGSVDKGYSVTFSNDQALAQIYTVSDVMQYAHSSMFNLCLMYGNRVLPQDKYEESYQKLRTSIESLIEKVTKKDRV
ncbi:MAG: hypothetical protein KA146_11540 [Leptospiraceae bacterium]|nr:hypothetical protein [Leptospiraceae bacterium]